MTAAALFSSALFYVFWIGMPVLLAVLVLWQFLVRTKWKYTASGIACIWFVLVFDIVAFDYQIGNWVFSSLLPFGFPKHPLLQLYGAINMFFPFYAAILVIVALMTLRFAAKIAAGALRDIGTLVAKWFY